MSMEAKMASLCRTCLVVLPSEDETCCHNLILERDLAVRFVECTLLTLDMLDEFPKCICLNCYDMLLKFNDFQKMCAESMSNFKNFLNEHMEILEGGIVEGSHDDNEEEVIGVKQEVLKGFDTAADLAKEESSVELEEVYIVSSTTGNDAFEHDKEEEISVPVGDTDNNQKQNTELNVKEHIPIAAQKSTSRSVVQAATASETITSNLFHCEHCPNRWFYKLDRLQAHLRTHLGLKPYVCKICSKEFGRATTLQTHIDDMHGTARAHYSCTYAGCKKVYAAARTLQHHINTAHLKCTVGKQHICEQCGKRFNRKLLLQRHCYVHMDNSLYPYACDCCDKRFWSKQFLRDHMNRHMDNKRFVCLVCETRKCTKGELKRHMQRHTGVRPFKCTLCKCSYVQKQHLVGHMNRKHQTT